MRIALLTGEYPPQPGGVGDYTHQLGLALSAEGCRVAILTIRDGRFLLYDQLWDSPSEPEQPFVALQPGSTAPKLSWSWRCWPYVWTAVQAWRPDWLHIQYQTGAYAMQAGINLLPRYLRLLPERPRIAVTFHDLLVPYLFPKAGRLRTWVNRRLATDAEAVITTNAGDASQLAAMKLRGPTLTTIPIGSNIAVAPPSGYQRAAWRTQLGVAPSELLVAYFGLLSQSKGVDLLIEALAQLGPGVPWRLLLIGGTATAPQDV
ncbi:MAG: glycosyltransferase family 4 protein, partial [Oscillochloris sp.]|nr:glycosyltransferase family 4 protein [Oscillochloris sp.]